MSEYTPELENEDDETPKTVTLSRSQIRALEKKAKERDDLATQLAQLTAERTFIEAGIDPKNTQHQYFMRGYDGEITVDAIKAKATEAGFLSAPEPDAEQTAALEAGQRVAAAASGAPAAGAANEASIRAEMEAAQKTGGKEAVLAVARKYGAVLTDDYA
jgi:hypothetical protein